MTPNEVEEIFAAAIEAYETVTSKPTFADINKSDEHDEDEYGIVYLSQDSSEYGTITRGSTLTKI